MSALPAIQACHLFDLADGLAAVIAAMSENVEDTERQAGLLSAAAHISEELRALAREHVESSNATTKRDAAALEDGGDAHG